MHRHMNFGSNTNARIQSQGSSAVIARGTAAQPGPGSRTTMLSSLRPVGLVAATRRVVSLTIEARLGALRSLASAGRQRNDVCLRMELMVVMVHCITLLVFHLISRWPERCPERRGREDRPPAAPGWRGQASHIRGALAKGGGASGDYLNTVWLWGHPDALAHKAIFITTRSLRAFGASGT